MPEKLKIPPENSKIYHKTRLLPYLTMCQLDKIRRSSFNPASIEGLLARLQQEKSEEERESGK